MAKLLVEMLADIEARDEGGWTAVYFAAQRGDRELCRCLVGLTADPRRLDSAGLTAFDYAKDIATRRALEREAQKPDASPKTPIEVVRDLEASRHVSSSDINARDAAGASVLIRAAERRLGDICVQVLRRPDFREVNSRGALGRTALHTAGAIGLSAVCLEVLSHPEFCEVNTPDERGRTALSVTAESGCLRVVRAILQHPDFWAVNVQDEGGRTALHAASMAGQAAICEEIVRCAAFCSLDAIDEWGNSALFYASGKGHVDVVEVLRSLGGRAIGFGKEVTGFSCPSCSSSPDRPSLDAVVSDKPPSAPATGKSPPRRYWCVGALLGRQA